jgi:tungstate transport system substrate-binding protein
MFKSWKKGLFILILVSLFAMSMLGCEEETPANPIDQPQAQDPAPVDEKPQFAKKELILATTTSTNDTGLLEVLLPKFEEQTGLEVKVISVGTGQAIELGQNGDADVILVHARASEDKFVSEGYGVNRRDVMYNDFVVIGPADDPAGVKGLSIEEAFAKFAEGNAKFISRGDNSGTHKKELEVWKSVNIEPAGDWYLSIGKGMGDTVNTANEMLGYTLADRGTFIKMEKNINLEIVIEGAAELLNPYGVIPVNQEKHADVNYEGAEAFAEFITSAEGKAIINNFVLEGKQLFFAE